jgi:hypothetical protein
MSPLAQTAKKKEHKENMFSVYVERSTKFGMLLYLKGGGHPPFIIKASHIELFGL